MSGYGSYNGGGGGYGGAGGGGYGGGYGGAAPAGGYSNGSVSNAFSSTKPALSVALHSAKPIGLDADTLFAPHLPFSVQQTASNATNTDDRYSNGGSNGYSSGGYGGGGGGYGGGRGGRGGGYGGAGGDRMGNLGDNLTAPDWGTDKQCLQVQRPVLTLLQTPQL